MAAEATARPRQCGVVRNTLLVISTCLFLLPLCLVLAHAVVSSNVSLYKDLARNGVKATAKVVRTEPTNHGSVFYEYRVNGREYQYGGPYSEPNPDLESLAIGDRLEIVYSRVNPGKSCACRPEVELRRNSSLMWPFGWGFTIFSTLAVINQWSARAHSPEGGPAAEPQILPGTSLEQSPHATSARVFLGGQFLGRVGGIVALAGMLRQSDLWMYGGFALAVSSLLVMAVLVAMNSRKLPLLGVGPIALARSGHLPARALALADALLMVGAAGTASLLVFA